MSTIKEISIFQVEVRNTKKDQYNVSVQWNAKISSGTYSDKWLVEVKEQHTGNIMESMTVDAPVRRCIFRNISLDSMKRYAVRVCDNKEKVLSAEEPIILRTYQNVVGIYDRKKIHLTWDAPDLNIEEGKCSVYLKRNGQYVGDILNYEIPAYVRGMDIPFPEEFYCRKEAFKIILTPFCSKKSSGPQAVIEELSAPQYRISHDGTIFGRSMEEKDGTFSLELQAMQVYKEDGGKEKIPAEPLSSELFSLTNTKPYTLTVKKDAVLDKTQYDSFIKQCYQYVTPEAMYEILDFISRSATQKIEDMLYYSCGLSENAQRADIRPGYGLRIEQAAYQYQPQMDKDMSGYTGNGVFTYKASLHQGDGMSYLEFDSFISRMEENLYSIDSNVEQQQIVAGALELCSVNMRHSYYRIQYPKTMYTSDVLLDASLDKHVLLLAAPGWDEVPIPSGKESTAAVPYLFFRGRSAVTLMFTITVNGKEEEIPAGTTLEKLLRQKGIFHAAPDVVRLFRRNPYGREAEVIIDGDENDRNVMEMFSGLPFLHGDRIEI